jgi:hypothetical protein
MAELRSCKICGSPFYPKVVNQLCCSPQCSKENCRLISRDLYNKKQTEAPKSKASDKKQVKTCDSFCDGCIYVRRMGVAGRSCAYLDVEDKRRPCPPGKGCTVKTTSRMTPEQRRQHRLRYLEERNEKQRQARMRTVICPICGLEFKTTDRRKKYCSNNCYNEGRKLSYLKIYGKKKGAL